MLDLYTFFGDGVCSAFVPRRTAPTTRSAQPVDVATTSAVIVRDSRAKDKRVPLKAEVLHVGVHL